MIETAERLDDDHAHPEQLTQADEGWAVLREHVWEWRDHLRADEPLLTALGLKSVSPNLVEFGPVMVARLEEAREREMSAREQLEALARANHDAQLETLESLLHLLSARNNSDLARRLDEVGRERFGLETATLAVEGFGAPVGWRGLRQGMVNLLLGEGEVRLGLATAREELFGDRAAKVKSMALIRLSIFEPRRPGVMAFGSADAEGFTRDMGAELVTFLARVVERTAERWPPV